MTENAGHQCHKDGCTAVATNEVHLHLSCPAPGLVARLISMKCSIEVCDKHKDDVAGYVLSDANKETICTTLMDQGLPEPDFLMARFEFKPILPAALVATEVPAKPVVVGCDREECTNPARWRVIQRFRALAQAGKGPPICEVLTNLNVCTLHKKAVKPADFLDEESRASTLAFLRGRGILLPDVDHPLIDFEELISGEPETSKIRRIIAR